eukprot:9997233-Karenia_brevis.AAC.1
MDLQTAWNYYDVPPSRTCGFNFPLAQITNVNPLSMIQIQLIWRPVNPKLGPPPHWTYTFSCPAINYN